MLQVMMAHRPAAMLAGEDMQMLHLCHGGSFRLERRLHQRRRQPQHRRQAKRRNRRRSVAVTMAEMKSACSCSPGGSWIVVP